jgi:hypothetical protein
MEAIGFLIAPVVIVFAFIGLLFYEENKGNKEAKIRQSDRKLQMFFYEMNLEANDGWTKKHYKELYEQRLNELTTKTK